MATFELASEPYRNGRRPFTAILYELQPPDCVVDDVGTKFNKNGVTFLEEYCSSKLDSIKDMSVTVSFIDEERTQICDHGETGTEDGIPVFDNATVVGHFTEGYITDTEINGEKKRVVAGKGFIDEMRYHGFVHWLETELANGHSVDGSIEIYKAKGNPAIVYKKGYLPQGRIPTEFIHSGWAMVLHPADTTSAVVELNNQNKKEKEEEITMPDLNIDEIKNVVKQTIVETNSQNETLNKQIAELNSQLKAKDDEISELNATIDKLQKDIEKSNDEQEQSATELNTLQEEVKTLKTEKLLTDLDTAIAGYTEDEVKYAEAEINSFKENPLEGNIDAITSKICVGIVTKQKEEQKKTSEINSVQNDKVTDIFTDIGNGDETDDAENISIF